MFVFIFRGSLYQIMDFPDFWVGLKKEFSFHYPWILSLLQLGDNFWFDDVTSETRWL